MARRSSRVALNHSDLSKILRGREVLRLLRDIGDEIQDLTGAPEDYEVQEWVGPTRARVTVRTIDDWGARAREARDHNLIAALAAFGGEVVERPDDLIEYTSSRGVVSMRTRAEVANYTRNRQG